MKVDRLGRVFMNAIFLSGVIALAINFPSGFPFWLMIAIALITNTYHTIFNNQE